MADPIRPDSRRARRERDASPPGVRVRIGSFAAGRRRAVAAGVGLIVVVGVVAGVAALVGGPRSAADDAADRSAPIGARVVPLATTLPVPAQSGDGASASASTLEAEPVPDPAVPGDPCADPAVQQALESGSDTDVVAAVGGGEAFRSAVAAGAASCLDLFDAGRIWVVVNKLNPLDPIDYWPEPQARAEGVERTSGGHMRADVAQALSQLVAVARDEGAGTIGVNSGFRSYDFQASTYRTYVGQLGQQQADLTSARPGHSEHQTGLAVDVVACDGGCGTIERFGGTAQSDWVAANAWRFGFIVRYGDGDTGTTGYEYEPWHLRYVGVDLATAYTEGGYRTLEDFFGLPAAPGYAG